jgi:hypothetical protein
VVRRRERLRDLRDDGVDLLRAFLLDVREDEDLPGARVSVPAIIARSDALP